jgi:hypothetical protein
MNSARHHLAVYDVEIVAFKREPPIQIIHLQVQIAWRVLGQDMRADVYSEDLATNVLSARTWKPNPQSPWRDFENKNVMLDFGHCLGRQRRERLAESNIRRHGGPWDPGRPPTRQIAREGRNQTPG